MSSVCRARGSHAHIVLAAPWDAVVWALWFGRYALYALGLAGGAYVVVIASQ